MRKVYMAIILTLTVITVVGARGANSYHTAKVSTNSVLVSCEDEREPIVTRLENTTAIVVTCQTH
jgi:hypothetical protein